MKILAKVNFDDESQKRNDLIRALFITQFNPKNKIEINDKDAELEITFQEKPPKEIVEALLNCKIEKLIYNNEDDAGANNTIQNEVNLEEIKQGDVEGDEQLPADDLAGGEGIKTPRVQENVGDVTENAKSDEPLTGPEDGKKTQEVVKENPTNDDGEKKVVEEQLQQDPGKEKANENISEKIAKLEEIASSSSSYEHFVKSVAEWLELSKRSELFGKLVLAAMNLKIVNWPNLEEELEKQDVEFNSYDKLVFTKGVREKFKAEGESVAILKCLKEIISYANFKFNSAIIQSGDPEDAGPIIKESENNSQKPQKPIKLACMPSIPEFEKMLGSIDTSLPIEQRVQTVLETMGLNKLEKMKKKRISKVANALIIIKDISSEKIREKSSSDERMEFSQFIYDYTKHFDSKGIKPADFLSQLQKAIILESELED